MLPPPRHQAQHLAARLPPLLVAARRIAATVAQGAHGRRRTGAGETFWQFRHSQPGDAASSIDWRQSARSDHLFLRESEWTAAQTVWLWRDGSASMRWRSGSELPVKRERAELLILAVAALLLRGGERVALLSGGLAPTTGVGALERLATALEREEDSPRRPGDGKIKFNSTLVLVGDFLSPLEEVAAWVGGLAATGVMGHLVQVLDPAEETLPYAGRVRFQGLEGEGELLARRAQDLRAPYRARLAAHRDGLAALARSLGWSFATHRTDQPPQHALLALYAQLALVRS
ncbi:MAG: DUF58 domain-containing protein [Phaeospirillum sp.]|nr:DUF58 domain-containing protein [Phaeospirillum sp.]